MNEPKDKKQRKRRTAGTDLTCCVMTNVERVCEQRGVTAKELAHEAGITVEYYYALQSKSDRPRMITLDLLARFADVLGVSASDLLAR